MENKTKLLIMGINGISQNTEDYSDISIDEVNFMLVGDINKYHKIEQKHWWSKKKPGFDLKKLAKDIMNGKIDIEGYSEPRIYLWKRK